MALGYAPTPHTGLNPAPENQATRVRSPRGRKRLPAGEKRDIILSIAVTPAEAMDIRRRAKAVGLRIPAYIRACCANIAQYGFTEEVQKA